MTTICLALGLILAGLGGSHEHVATPPGVSPLGSRLPERGEAAAGSPGDLGLIGGRGEAERDPVSARGAAHTQALAQAVDPALTPPALGWHGVANYADPSHGPDYLAIRAPRGTWVTITGKGGTVTMASTDYGPARSTGDVADIALVRFAKVCGWSVPVARRMGECTVTIETVDASLPATDTAP
jgi:hypothetical protein